MPGFEFCAHAAPLIEPSSTTAEENHHRFHWNLMVVHGDVLAIFIEVQSQVGRSF